MNFKDIDNGQVFKDATNSTLVKVTENTYNILADKYGNTVKSGWTTDKFKVKRKTIGYVHPIKIVRYMPKPTELLYVVTSARHVV